MDQRTDGRTDDATADCRFIASSLSTSYSTYSPLASSWLPAQRGKTHTRCEIIGLAKERERERDANALLPCYLLTYKLNSNFSHSLDPSGYMTSSAGLCRVDKAWQDKAEQSRADGLRCRKDIKITSQTLDIRH